MPSELAEELADRRWRVVAPAIVAEQVAGGVPMKTARAMRAMFELHRAARVGAVRGAEHRAGTRASILGLQRERAAERVEAEQRIRPRHQRRRSDGDTRNEIPAHDVA